MVLAAEPPMYLPYTSDVPVSAKARHGAFCSDRLADLNHQYAQVTYGDTVFGTHKKSGGPRVR